MDNPSPNSEPVRASVEYQVNHDGEKRVYPTAAELFGKARHVELAIKPPAPFLPCNPSIVADPETGGWLCAVRAVDYRLGVPTTAASSKNYLATLSPSLELGEVVEVVDRSRTVKNHRSNNRGFEDLRLFWRGRTLMAMATACDLANGGTYPEMCRLTLDRDGVIANVRPVRGPWSRMPQKNWMVVADGYGARSLYRIHPKLVVFPDDMCSEWAGAYGAERLIDEHDFVPSSIRGSSQLIPCGGGFLCVVHEHISKKPLLYAHRFAWLDAELNVQKVSDEFVWLSVGIEFCAGLAIADDRVIASFGVNDRSAHLIELDLRYVIEKLRPLRD